MSMTGMLNRLLGKLQSKKYRDAYVAAETATGIAYQIRALREQRKWTQDELGQRLGKGQNAVSRLEDPDYGRLSVKTLVELANAFDVGLLVKFVPFSRMITEIADRSPQGLEVASFSEGSLVAEASTDSRETSMYQQITTASVVPFRTPKTTPLQPNPQLETMDIPLLPNIVNG